MVRKRKRRSLPVGAVIDACDIETQVERDRLKELERENDLSSVSKMTNGRSRTAVLSQTTASYSSDRGSFRSIYSKEGKGSQRSLNSNPSSINSLSLENGSNGSSGTKNKPIFSYENRASSASSPCGIKIKMASPNDEKNTNEYDDEKKIVDNGFINLNDVEEVDAISKERYSERELVCQFVTLRDLSSLEEGVDSFEIDGNAIVQNYLQQLGVTTRGNNDDRLSSGTLGAKFVEMKKWPQNVEILNDTKNNLSQFRRKSSLRKKSTDEPHKASVSFQEPNGFNSRRVKSATAVRTEDKQHQLLRPRTALHTMKLQPESGVLNQTTDERHVSSSTNISNDKHSHEPFQDNIKGKAEIKRQTSAVSRASEFSYTSRQKCPSVTYDPELERATTYIHGRNKQFSRANTSITPLKHGLKYLQMNYSGNNLEHNQSLIFLDLLKNVCSKSHIRYSGIRNIERRLEMKRINPLYSTTFYEHKHLIDPYRVTVRKVARTVAQKKNERKEKIKKMTDEMLGSFTPTCLTMKIADQTEVDDIGRNCRYLRCSPPPLLDESKQDVAPVQVTVTKAPESN